MGCCSLGQYAYSSGSAQSLTACSRTASSGLPVSLCALKQIAHKGIRAISSGYQLCSKMYFLFPMLFKNSKEKQKTKLKNTPVGKCFAPGANIVRRFRKNNPRLGKLQLVQNRLDECKYPPMYITDARRMTLGSSDTVTVFFSTHAQKYLRHFRRP